MVDERRLTRLIERASGAVSELEERAARDRRRLRTDKDQLAATKYWFAVAIEACFTIAHHLCASEGYGPPDSNADAVIRIARHEVIDDGLAQRVAEAVKFRNLLVHQYADVDDDRTVGHLDDVGDLQAFVTQVARWLEIEAQ